MNKIYHTHIEQYIAYNKYKSNKKKAPYVIFLHGLMSGMEGTKALYLEEYCKKKEYNFIRFDNFGHGKSSGDFLDETIGSWLLGLEIVMNNIVESPPILVGSSMGGWISLLYGLKYPEKIKGIVGIASAVDFTENVIWRKLPPLLQTKMQNEGWLEVKLEDCTESYPISYKLIEEARNHLLFSFDSIQINLPVHLVHGIKDADVPYNVSMQIMEKLSSQNVVLKLIKDGDHRLSRPDDLEIIANSIENLINFEVNEIN